MPLKRILFVDDEMLLRMAIVPGLEDAGLIVEEAGNGKRALEIFRAKPAEFSCAVIDVGLPDMKGDGLIAVFRALSPQLGIVLATGYGDAVLVKAFNADRGVRVLAKPYFIEDLMAAIDAVGVGVSAAADTETPDIHPA